MTISTPHGTREARVWEIVDLRELPALRAAYARGGCGVVKVGGAEILVDTALLIYAPGQQTKIIYVAPNRTSPAEDHLTLQRLLKQLRIRCQRANVPVPRTRMAIQTARSLLPVLLHKEAAVSESFDAISSLLMAENLNQTELAAHNHPTLLEESAARALEILVDTPYFDADIDEWQSNLARAQQYRRAIIDLRKRGASKLARLVAELQTALRLYTLSRDLTELRKLGRLIRALLRHPDLTTAPRKDRFDYLHLAARARIAMYVRTGKGLDDARSLFGRTLKLATNVDDRADALDSFAIGLAERIGFAGGSNELLSEAFIRARRAVAMTPPGHPKRGSFLSTLALIRRQRFSRNGNLIDLDEAVRCSAEALSDESLTNGDRATLLNTSAEVLSERYQRLGQTADLDTAIAQIEQALELTSGVDRHPALFGLARRLHDRFLATSDVEHLAGAIDTARELVAAVPSDHPNRPAYLDILTTCLGTMFVMDMDTNKLEEGMQHAREAAKLTEGGPDEAGYLHALTNQLTLRFDAIGDVADLEEAIRALERCLELLSPDAPFRAEIHRAASHRRLIRYERFGEPDDVDAAIAHADDALALTAQDAASRRSVLSTRASALSHRFELHGDVADLDAAVDDGRAAVALAPRGSVDRAPLLNDLSNLFSVRHARLGRIADADAAVACVEEAIIITPELHADHAMLRNTRAGAYFNRYRDTDDTRDLAAGRIAAEEAVRFIPRNHPDRPIYLNSLATLCEAVFQKTGQRKEIDRAVNASRAAASDCPEDDAYLPVYLNSLANALAQRFKVTKRRRDIDEAVETSAKVLRLTPAKDPSLSMRLGNHAIHRAERFRIFKERRDLRSAELHFDTSLKVIRETVTKTIEPGLLAARANDTARDFVGFLWDSGQSHRIVEIVESARGVRLRSELSRLDSPPLHLPSLDRRRYREQAKRLRVLRLEAASGMRAIATSTSDADAARFRSSWLKKLRRLRRAESSLHSVDADGGHLEPKPSTAASVASLAKQLKAAIVYLYPVDSVLGSIWLVVHAGTRPDTVHPDDIGFVPELSPSKLRNLIVRPGSAKAPGWFEAHRKWVEAELVDETAATARRRAWHSTIDRTLNSIASPLLTPVARRLRALGLDRVVLIPCAELAVLPLPATGIVGSIPFGEAFETSLAPSAAVLERSFMNTPAPTTSSVVGIGNPHGDLPFAQLQLQSLQRRLPRGRVKVRVGAAATKAWLRSQARTADYIELSTHARFVTDQPTASCIELSGPQAHLTRSTQLRAWPVRMRQGQVAEDQLSLAEVWSGAFQFRRGCFVSANACETGLASLDTGEIEEQVGFTSAFLSNGARGVLASYWAVSDFATLLVMEHLYDGMLGAGLRPGRALQKATMALRRMTKNAVVARLDAETDRAAAILAEAQSAWRSLPVGDQARREAAASVRVARLAVQQANTERRRIVHERRKRPFDHPYYYGAFALHGAG